MTLLNIAATNWLWRLLAAHRAGAAFAAAYVFYWMFSAYASQIHEPLPMGNRFYKWWYAVVHLAAANLDRFMSKK